MCKKMTFLICIVSVLALAGNAPGGITVKVDLSCPGNAGTKAGGDWQDFEWGNGCDGDRHDRRSYTTPEGITFTAGDPGGYSNLFNEGGDALHNTILQNYEGGLGQNLFTVRGLPVGDYEILVDGEGGASGTYNVTSGGPGSTYTIFDKNCGLDNFILTGGAAPELQACCMPDGSCQDLTEEECAAQGGAAQGEGTDCATTECPQPPSPEACCIPDGSCEDLTEEDCAAQGGAAQGEGTACSETTIACCVADGECVDADPLCCDDLDGAPGYADMCLGDLNGNNIDDACEEPCACLGDLDTNDQVDLQDLDAMVNLLVAAGPPFIVDCPDVRCYCADFDDSGQVDLQDLDAMVNLLVAAGPPFIVDCTPD